jgi:hypothetical protein
MQAEIAEEAIDVRPIRYGLRALEQRMPGEPPHVHEFGKLLASYLNDSIYPSSIRLAVSLLMHDVARGQSGYSMVAMPAKLAGLPRLALAALEMRIPDMLRAAGGEAHAGAAEQLATALRGVA